jgi:cob(I)alamin adenosyltransferase
MKIYTKTGDAGETGLFGGERVRKNDPRVEAYGTIDELNALLGVVRASGLPANIEASLARIQGELFVLGAELACAPEKLDRLRMPLLSLAATTALEREIDEHESHLAPLETFILPTGCIAGATLHSARTVCRRAERRILDLPEIRHELVIYVNRLSDHLFVLARRVNALAETPETPWTGRDSV